jgi:predicted metalloprotease with PDZ domain
VISYSVAFPEPGAHYAAVEAVFPVEGRETLDLMMAVWSPGFYRAEDYAGRIDEISAHRPTGASLPLRRTRRNRWRVETRGAAKVVVRYRLRCEDQSVTTNWVGDDSAVLNGPATFLILAGQLDRPHEVRLELAEGWTQSACALANIRGAHRYRAPDFNTLADSPILAGRLTVDRFEVDGCEHRVICAGDLTRWERARGLADLERIVRGHLRLWGFLPFDRYAFLLLFREGGGGLEHRDCTLVTTNPAAMRSAARYRHWLGLVCHEYLHAYNVKRLRPRELGPFDYGRVPRTPSLWVSEGLTVYYGDLVLVRSGLLSRRHFLARLSSHVDLLQSSPGRHSQTLAQSSLGVWTNSFSGLNPNDRAVSFYAKGAVVGFLLDARIRGATNGARSLDDVMRLAYMRHSGARGFTPRQFRRTVSDASGLDLGEWLDRAVISTEELSYEEALEVFGLRFEPGSWKLVPRSRVTRAQRDAFRRWIGVIEHTATI